MKFRFEGREIQTNAGDTYASALYRAGQRIFSRSFKYHRPRGLLCVAGKCPNCLMNVDAVPNIRTCITPVRDGAEVRAQNAKPSLERDWLSISQHFDWLMPVGWYYKTFKSPVVWHAVEPFIRRVAGLGELRPGPKREYEHSWMHTHTAVIGGGYAGLEAALKASERGERVVLIDDQPELGGQARYHRSLPTELIARVRSQSSIQVLLGSTCFGLYEGNLLGIVQFNPHPNARERLIHLRAHHVVVAAGAYETPLLFPNNDLPGAMLSTAVLRLLHVHGVVAGKRTVIVGTGKRAEEVADELRSNGAEVVSVVSPADGITATGSGKVSGLRTLENSLACDLIVMCGPLVPDSGLAVQAGARLIWSEVHGVFLPSDLPPQISVVGDAAGDTLAPVTRSVAEHKRSFVCLCSDVTSKDVCAGIAEGFDHIETLKRYTTATMGPCQGSMCQLSTIGICAHQAQRSMGETGVTTSRPPNPSVTIGALAGSRHHPIRHTPMHYAHEALGAVWMDMGDWKRPRQYRLSIEDEYRAVREGVGIIDVSTLGKLDLRGRDAGKLLDMVYTHRFSDLRPGRVRYALMCDEGGTILDDGTISRLAGDRYFITTTTGNLDFVHQWLEWYLIGTGWDVTITNVTAGYGSINVAGPKAREVLQKLTDCDLATSAFPYMACREADVCGVAAIMLRIGFVGETGWELHLPAESAEAVWNNLLDAGKELGIQAFGVEAQRLLRLEKRHVIVGVDTDALSGPFESGMAWAAKLEKDDFVGKVALTEASASPARESLVGFMVTGVGVPEDGSAVVVDGKLAGRVTSCRYSPAKKTAIGLAWVPVDSAEEGARIQVRIHGKLADAKVTMEAFYDPEGARLRQ